MKIELKEIDKDELKVGDVACVVAEKLAFGWMITFRCKKMIPVTIERITPKRKAFITTEMGRILSSEQFYKYDDNAKKENEFAKMFEEFSKYDLKMFDVPYKLKKINNEDLSEVAEHMKAITEILQKYKEK